MDESERVWTVEELADLVGVPVRTIRYYISEGLLPGPGTRGKGTVYSDAHLRRLRLIRILTERRVPLAQIREQVGSLSLAEVNALLEEEERRSGAVARAARSQSPREYLSSLLDQAKAHRPSPPVQTLSPSPRMAESPRSPGVERQEPVDPLGAEERAPAWYRYELEPGVELHVRADVRERRKELVERLLEAARRAASARR